MLLFNLFYPLYFLFMLLIYFFLNIPSMHVMDADSEIHGSKLN